MAKGNYTMESQMGGSGQTAVDAVRRKVARLEHVFADLLHGVDSQRAALRGLRAVLADSPHRQDVQDVMTSSTRMGRRARQADALLSLVEDALDALEGHLRDVGREQAQLQALARVGAVVNSTLDLDQVLNRVIDTVIEITGAERGYLVLRDEESGTLQFRVARNMDRQTLRQDSFRVSQTVVNRVAESGEPVLTTNAQVDPRFRDRESVVGFGLQSILCVPLRAKDTVIGVMYADNSVKSSLFGERELGLLSAFANQAAVAIDNAVLFERVSSARKLMDSILASITSGVVTTDMAGKITLLNRAAEQILRVLGARCEGAMCSEAFPALARTLPPLVEQVKRTDQPVRDYEADSQVTGRGQVSLRMSVSPLKDANNDTQGVAIVVDDVTERRRYERERRAVKRYLPAELVDRLADLQELRLGGTRETVSVLFADIRGFTAYSEVHDPEQVVELVNRYYGYVSDIVRRCEGIVDKYEGDAIMAHFGTPLRPIHDHAWRAVCAAWQIQRAVQTYHTILPAEDRLLLGIGVNTGEAVAGNIGGEEQMDYTLIGDAVNLSRRLQEAAAGGDILLGHATYELIRQQVTVETLPPLRVRGRAAQEQVFRLMGIRE
jgi:adenylate cyclase